MHQIDQLGRVLQQLLAELTGAQGPAASVQDIKQRLNDAIGNAMTDLDRDPQQVVQTLAHEPALTPANADHLAALLWGMADALEEAPSAPEGVKKYRERALSILEHLNATDPNYSLERHAKVAAWKARITR